MMVNHLYYSFDNNFTFCGLEYPLAFIHRSFRPAIRCDDPFDSEIIKIFFAIIPAVRIKSDPGRIFFKQTLVLELPYTTTNNAFCRTKNIPELFHVAG